MPWWGWVAVGVVVGGAAVAFAGFVYLLWAFRDMDI